MGEGVSAEELSRLQCALQAARGPARGAAARALLERALHGVCGAGGGGDTTALRPLLPELMSLAADRAPDVRRALAASIQDLCSVAPSLVAESLDALCLLVQDSAPAVQKRAIQAASIAYRLVAAQQPPAAAAERLSNLKLLVLNLIDSDNEGVRTHSIKFLEEVVVVAADGGGSAAEEAEHIFELLLKFQSSGHVSSVNLMACMTSLVNMSRGRAAWAARVSAALQREPPASLSAGQAASVRKHARALASKLRPAPDKRRARDRPAPERPDKRPRRAAPAPPPAPAPAPEEALAGALQDVPRVVGLVLDALRRLPAAMPPDFAALYRPQPAAPLPVQRLRLARLLLTEAPPPVQREEPEAAAPPVLEDDEDDRDEFESDEKEVIKEDKVTVPFLKDEDEKAALKSAVAKLQEAGRTEEVVVPLQERVQLLRLEAVTAPLEAEARERVIEEAASRVAGAAVGGATRGKLAALLGAAHGGVARGAVRRALLAEGGARLSELLAWLYQEYAYVAGFARLPVTLAARPEPPQQHYDELLGAAVERLEAAGSESALRRLVLEAPRLGAAGGALPLTVLEERAARGEAAAARQVAARGGAAAARLWAAGRAARGELRRAAERQWAAGRPELALTLAGQSPELLLLVARRAARLEGTERRALLQELEPALAGAAAEGPDSPLLGALLGDCPAAAEPLLARLLQLLAEKGPLPEAVVTSVRAVFARCGDVRLLLPLLPQLHRTEIIAALPAVVRLGGAGLRAALLKLVSPPAVLSPGQLVEELHLVEVGQAELKQLIRATALCFSEPAHFPPVQVVEALERLAARCGGQGVEVPVLLARSLLQALALDGAAGGAGAAGGVARALAGLLRARCWRRRVVWEGWLKCAARLAAQGHPALPGLLAAAPRDQLPPDLQLLAPDQLPPDLQAAAPRDQLPADLQLLAGPEPAHT